MTARVRDARSGRDDRGSIAPLVPIVMFALLLLGGLVVDGSRELNARGNAQAFAEEAARAGATAIEPDQATLVLDFRTAHDRVAAYCAAIMNTAHADVDVTKCQMDGDPTQAQTCSNDNAPIVDRIVVHTIVQVQIKTTLLGLADFTTLSSTARASARPYEYIGITADGVGPC